MKLVDAPQLGDIAQLTRPDHKCSGRENAVLGHRPQAGGRRDAPRFTVQQPQQLLASVLPRARLKCLAVEAQELARVFPIVSLGYEQVGGVDAQATLWLFPVLPE